MTTRLLLVMAMALQLAAAGYATAATEILELAGITVTPHVQATGMRYRREPDQSLGGRVQLFLRNRGDSEIPMPSILATRFRGKTLDELIRAGEWAWHDTPSARQDVDLMLPAGAMTVWQFNSRGAAWGAGTDVDLEIGPANGLPEQRLDLHLTAPQAWLSAVTFLGDEESAYPNQVVFHFANQTSGALRLSACRLWLPSDNTSWRALLPGPCPPITIAFPSDGMIPPGE